MNSTDGKLLSTVPPESDRRPPNPGADPDLGDAVDASPAVRSGSDPDVRSVRPTTLPRIDRLTDDPTANRPRSDPPSSASDSTADD